MSVVLRLQSMVLKRLGRREIEMLCPANARSCGFYCGTKQEQE